MRRAGGAIGLASVQRRPRFDSRREGKESATAREWKGPDRRSATVRRPGFYRYLPAGVVPGESVQCCEKCALDRVARELKRRDMTDTQLAGWRHAIAEQRVMAPVSVNQANQTVDAAPFTSPDKVGPPPKRNLWIAAGDQRKRQTRLGRLEGLQSEH